MLNSQISGIRSLLSKPKAAYSDIAVSESVSQAYLFLSEPGEKFFTPFSPGSRIFADKPISHTESGFKIFSPFDGTVEEKLMIRHPLAGRLPAFKISNPTFKPALPESYDDNVRYGDDVTETAAKFGIIDETDGERLYKKLNRIRSSKPGILVCNALADMPYEEAKTGLLRQFGNQIASALTACSLAVGASRCCIAVFAGKNSPEFPESICGVPVMKINFRYPSKPILDMQIRGWGGGDSIGAAALFALYRAAAFKIPHTGTIITVDGTGVSEPKNILAPFGAPVGEIAKLCSLSDMPHTYIIGGVMAGKVCSPETPVSPAVTSIIVNDVKSAEARRECIGCSECVGVCPKKILPVHIMKALERRNLSLLKKLNPELCIGCGCCSFVCPSRLNIMQSVKEAAKLVQD